MSNKRIYQKIKGKIVEHGLSQAKVAQLLGISTNSLNSKLNGKVEFTICEATNLIEILNISDPIDVFFAPDLRIM